MHSRTPLTRGVTGLCRLEPTCALVVTVGIRRGAGGSCYFRKQEAAQELVEHAWGFDTWLVTKEARETLGPLQGEIAAGTGAGLILALLACAAIICFCFWYRNGKKAESYAELKEPPEEKPAAGPTLDARSPAIIQRGVPDCAGRTKLQVDRRGHLLLPVRSARWDICRVGLCAPRVFACVPP